MTRIYYFLESEMDYAFGFCTYWDGHIRLEQMKVNDYWKVEI